MSLDVSRIQLLLQIMERTFKGPYHGLELSHQLLRLVSLNVIWNEGFDGSGLSSSRRGAPFG